ncbi:hypothetical protein HHK36_030822 [Tetracentron sinense]|uniref:Uncharacterized protein n=1 Tax=Tetracentron sinense TaxID=13715 RepID=A0A834YDF5_TETSI|nr:hypothetical protein HHK36_030822 [Tetracentron sinense]
MPKHTSNGTGEDWISISHEATVLPVGSNAWNFQVESHAQMVNIIFTKYFKTFSSSSSSSSSTATSWFSAESHNLDEECLMRNATPNLKIFSFAELKNATRNFRPDSVIGEGGFGKVFKGWLDEKTYAPSRTGTGTVIAVKKLNPEGFKGLPEWQVMITLLHFETSLSLLLRRPFRFLPSPADGDSFQVKSLAQMVNIIITKYMEISSGSSSSSSSTATSWFSATNGSLDKAFPNGHILPTSNLKIFTFAQLYNATSNFSPDMVIGKGAFGKVFKGWLDEKTYAPSNIGTGMVIAVKKLDPDSWQGLEEWQIEGSSSLFALTRMLIEGAGDAPLRIFKLYCLAPSIITGYHCHCLAQFVIVQSSITGTHALVIFTLNVWSDEGIVVWQQLTPSHPLSVALSSLHVDMHPPTISPLQPHPISGDGRRIIATYGREFVISS